MDFSKPTPQPPYILRKTNLISIQLYTIVKQPIQSRLKVKNMLKLSVIC